MTATETRLDDRLASIVPRLNTAIRDNAPRVPKGRIRRVLGVIIHATVKDVRIGEVCRLIDPITRQSEMAEVVGLVDDCAVLTPIGDLSGLSCETEVERTGAELRIPVGPGLLGRVIDALARPLDGRPLPAADIAALYPVAASPPAPLLRRPIDRPVQLGIRALDGLV